MKRRVLTALIVSAVLTLAMGLGVLYVPDNAFCDALYQRTGLQNSSIMVIGIDQETIDELGPVTGLRGEMATAIEILNADPDKQPAVIGIDLMYTGENREAKDSDERLAAAASKYQNVVVGADAKFGDQAVFTNGAFSIKTHNVIGWYPPYPALAKAALYGHINEMLDKDGIFRHALISIHTPEGTQIDSFAKAIYSLWCKRTDTPKSNDPKTSAHGFYYLPFSSSEQGYSDGFNFLDLVNGKIDPYYYKDKIILIGPTAPGMQDAYITSLNHAAEMPGVAIQANIIEAFQKGFFPREVSEALQLCVCFIICFLISFFLWKRRIISSVIIWILTCALWILICILGYKSGLILHALWIPVCATLLFIASVAWNYAFTRKEKRIVTDTFGHYIDPTVMNQLLKEGPDALELGGKTQDIAVLFVDIRGFTAMSEKLDAETVVEIVNRYLTLTTECIVRNHGTLDKFVGDCTMAVWNAPIEQEDPVYFACRAALDMIEGSKALSDELMERFGQSVDFGIGINWGPAVVGNIGAPKRMDYTAIGDTVNTASRLEANAEGGTILISRAVADALGDRAKTISLGSSIKLKGKSEGFEILRLLELNEES
ncbi:MAG: CHASE2 domain-containing protein [Lachnospiraceae bacterium]|nr:CHASE2 domain-containing protein [Lachnospiraceae bacterium]